MAMMRSFVMTKGCIKVLFEAGGNKCFINGKAVDVDTMNAEFRRYKAAGFKSLKTEAPKEPEAPKTEAPKEPRKKWHFPNGFNHDEYIETAVAMGYSVWKRGDKMIVHAKNKTDIYLTMGAYYA